MPTADLPSGLLSPRRLEMSDGRATIGVAGLGAVGTAVASAVAASPELRLTAVAGRDPARTDARLRELGIDAKAVSVEALPSHAEIIVEALPAAAFDELAGPAVRAGRILVVMSAGALLQRADLVAEAERTGGVLVVASGALAGLDAVRAVAASSAGFDSLRLISRKPPAAFAGSAWATSRGLSVEGLDAPLLMFDGSAREAVRAFPANANVAAALALAGPGPDATAVQIWADPTVTRNSHLVQLRSSVANIDIDVEAAVSAANPRTSALAALSALATVRSLTRALR